MRSPALKRALDVFLSALGLLVLSLPLALIGLFVRSRLGSPVIFRQVRPGLGGRPFSMYKFRTMRDGPEPDEQRLTAAGRFLRSTSLDELPELLNVLRGDMSLVGPRPLLMAYLPRYSPEQARRHEVRPGITGWAQVNGRNAIGWDARLAMDVWYVDHWTVALDLRILWMTVFKVLARSGVNAEGHATMSEFQGPES